jgi:hypothetical protein
MCPTPCPAPEFHNMKFRDKQATNIKSRVIQALISGANLRAGT